MHNLFFAWDQAYTRTEMAIFSEIWAQFIALLRTTRKIMPTVPEIITENVIKQLEQGVAPWRKPWSTSMPRNLISKRAYRGLNTGSSSLAGSLGEIDSRGEALQNAARKDRNLQMRCLQRSSGPGTRPGLLSVE
jgi:hypothetical protein